MAKCKICKRKLGLYNKSGYCTKDYVKSPFYKQYQKQNQKEWFSKPKNKLKKKTYRQKPEVKKKYKIYQKKYQKENIERLRIIKREWARKNR